MSCHEIEWVPAEAFPGHYFGYGQHDRLSATWRLQKMDPKAEKKARRWRLLCVPTMGVTYFPSMKMAKAYADDIQFLRDHEEA